MYIVLRRSYGFPVLANIFLPLTSHFPQINVTTVTHTPWRSKRTKSRRTYIIPHIIAKLGSSLPLFCSIQGSLYLSLKLEFVEVLCFLTETPWRLEFRLLQAHQRTVSNKKLTRFRHPFLSQSPTRKKICGISSTFRKIKTLGVCLVMEKKTEDVIQVDEEIKSADGIKNQITGASRAAERLARKPFERYTYLVAAIMSSLGVTSMAAISVYYRFSWQMEVHKSRLSIN